MLLMFLISIVSWFLEWFYEQAELGKWKYLGVYSMKSI